MSEADKNLPSVKKSNDGAVELHGSGIRAGRILEDSLARLTEDEASALRLKAAEAALGIEIKRIQQNIDYEAGKRGIDDHIEAFDGLQKQGSLV